MGTRKEVLYEGAIEESTRQSYFIVVEEGTIRDKFSDGPIPSHDFAQDILEEGARTIATREVKLDTGDFEALNFLKEIQCFNF